MWLLAGAVLLVGLVPCLVVCLRGSRWDAVVALQVAGAVVTVVLVVLSMGFERPAYFWVPLVFAPLAVVGALAFVRIMARWV